MAGLNLTMLVSMPQRFRSSKRSMGSRELSTLDVMKKVAADPNSGVNAFVARHLGGDSSEDEDEDVGTSSSSQPGSLQDGRYTFIDTSWPERPSSFDVPAYPVGFAMKKGGKRKQPATPGQPREQKMAKHTRAVLEFLEWCFVRGNRNAKDKISPHVAEKLMPLHGTDAGHKRFPEDAYWVPNRQLDEHGRARPTFRRPELLDHHAFRPWFSSQAAKQKIEKERLAQGRAIVDELRRGRAESSEDEDEGS